MVGRQPESGDVLHVGGTILVAANQPDGDYESTFDITADYQ